MGVMTPRSVGGRSLNDDAAAAAGAGAAAAGAGAIQFVNSSSGDFVELGAAAGVVGGGSGQPLLTSMVSSLTGSDDTFFTATSSAASEAFFTELRFRAMYALSGCFIAGVGGLLCDRAKPGGCAPADGKQGSHDGIDARALAAMRKYERVFSLLGAVLSTMIKPAE